MENNQIIELLRELANQLGIAVDWTSQNIKPFIVEIMNRNARLTIFNSIIWMAFAAIFMTLSIVAMHKMIKSCDGIRYALHDNDVSAFIVFAIVVFLVSTFVMFDEFYNIGKAIYMPELLLIEKLKSLSN